MIHRTLRTVLVAVTLTCGVGGMVAALTATPTSTAVVKPAGLSWDGRTR